MAEFTREEFLDRLKAGQSLDRADLSGLQLQGVSLAQANLARADLAGANLSNADLREAVLTSACLKEAFLQGANLARAALRNADLDGANLAGADLEGADASRANLEGANLEGAKLNGTRLQNAMLTDANLGKAELAEADLRSADLSGAYLGGAILLGTDLRKAGLENANLEEADLSGADLRECDLSTAQMTGAVLDGARVFGVLLPLEALGLLKVSSWDVSRSGDGSVKEEGAHIGAFLGAIPAAPAAPSSTPGERYFGPTDVVKNAEFEFGPASMVALEGRFENCRVSLAEGATLRVGPSGSLIDCQITGRGNVLVYGRMQSERGKAIAAPKMFLVGSTGSAVGTIRQRSEPTRFVFEPGCILRLEIKN